MKFETIANTILKLKKDDLTLRKKLLELGQLNEGYNEEMAELHDRNAQLLNDIIDSIGYPTIDKVGNAGSDAAWLIIQHSIGQPKFMKKCEELLKKAVLDGKANPKNLAYLTDRIAVFEEKPQLYGTQFDWDENGEMNPQPFDDLTKINERRTSINLNTLEEQIDIIRKRTKEENQHPPTNFEENRKAMNKWKKLVGWKNK